MKMESSPIIYLEITDRDGETMHLEEYDTVEELLTDWPHAVRDREGNYSCWIGGKR